MAEAPNNLKATEAQKRRRKPSTGFPIIGLSEVTAALTKAAQHGWEHSVAEIAGYLGHTTTNSGAFRMKLAALRDYGVVSGRGDELQITEIGRTIAVPESLEDRARALQEAFLNTVFGPLYEESVKGTPIAVESLGRRAVNRLGVAASSQSSFADAFTKSAVEAGLAELGGDGRITLLHRGERTLSVPESAASTSTSIATDSRGSATTYTPTSRRKPVVDQRWAVGADGEVALTISLDRPLSASDFAAIGAVVQQIEQLVDGLKSGDSSG